MNSLSDRLARLVIPLLTVALLAVVAPNLRAQTIQLTPEQQQMLNQLPPAQRAEAMRQIELLQRGSSVDGTQPSMLPEDLSSLLEGELPTDAEAEEEIEELRAEPNSRLIVTLELKEDLERQELREFERDPALLRIEGSRYYELDDAGVLNLPGLPSIPLIGLTAEQIEQRLGAEPSLGVFDVTATLLETTTFGVDALEPFGYDLFDADDNRFEPVMTGPVPADYVLGPGDSVRVQLFGAQNGIYEFEVTRDGILTLPELGPIPVAGLPFSEFRQDLNRRVEEMLIGTQVSATMGQLRTMRVFVLGDVERPGSYVVSSLATISSALYQSGGISPVGSLRNIQLKRSGETVARLDLYDALLRGDTSGDVRLQPGDVIFIPPIGPQVSISGAVKRPAIYETRGRTSIGEAVRLAGGLLAEAYPSGARIERIEGSQIRKVLSIDVADAAQSAEPVQAGDALFVPQILPQLEQTVTLVGHVHRPGPYEWRAGMRLSDLLPSELALQSGADTGYVLIRREDPRTRRVSAVSANLSDALARPGSAANIPLQARDTVHVFSLAFGRQRVIEPLLEELQLQGRSGEPYREVSVSGQVKAPGSYPLESDMRVSDLLRAGGNLSEEAYALRAEIARYEIVDGEYRDTEVVEVDLAAILRGDPTADIALMEHDNLRISSIPEWDSLWTVSLEGEIRFPGEYRIRRGETLRQVLERAGGLTDAAFAEGAIFLREALREREQEQLEILARRLESDLTSLSLQNIDTSGAETLDTGQQLLAQIRATEPVGRLVIDIQQLTARAGNAGLVTDVELRDGDQLLVPKQAQEVTVIGETQQNTSHLFQPGLKRNDYIEMSGGLTRRADRRLIYIVRASGAVVTGSRSRWFGRSAQGDVQAGDTIVVPLDTDRIRPITFWGNVTQILYQAAIAVAAVETFRN
jgi:protein involved in polysaccharide export with SLBB domain